MHTINDAARPGRAAAPAPDLLVFLAGGEQFGIDIRHVRECVHYRSLSLVADGATPVEGVALWRGQVLALVDLRAARHGPAPLTEIIILTLGSRLVGLAVDGVADVIALASADIRPLPAAPGLSAAGLTGCAMYRQRHLLVLDVGALLAATGAPMCAA